VDRDIRFPGESSEYHGERNLLLGHDGQAIRHSWATEFLFARRDEDSEPRHVDSIWPIWNVPDGAHVDWRLGDDPLRGDPDGTVVATRARQSISTRQAEACWPR